MNLPVTHDREPQYLPSRRDIAWLVAIGLLQAVSVVASVLLIRALVDRLNSPAPATDALPLAFVFVGFALLLAVARGLEYSVSERVGYRLAARLRMTLHSHLLVLPARSLQRSSQGALLLRFTGDLSTLRTWISRGLSRGVVSSVTLVAGLGVVFVIDWALGLAIVGVVLLGAAMSALWGYKVRRATRAVRWRRSLLASNVAEQIRSLAVVQTFGRSSGEAYRLSAQNDDLLGALNRAATARGFLRFYSSAAGSVAVGAVMIVGVFQLERQQVSLGGVVAAMTATRFMTGPIRTLGRSHEYWQAAQVSRRKLQDFLARPGRPRADEDLPPLRPRRGAIELLSVSVDDALRDLSLRIEPRNHVAIVGPNGAGKSTLLAVIARLVEPTSGQVLIDDQVLAEHNIRSTVRNIGIVSPDLPLMRGTIRRNIGYRYSHATDAQIQQAVLNCRVDEVLNAVDGGLGAWLTEAGGNLSVGHRQRVALARAILGHPRLLLLDEPTANLDPATKEIFRRVVARYSGTVVLVTHDPVEAALADQVIMMEAGSVTRTLTGAEYRAEMTEQRRVQAGRVQW